MEEDAGNDEAALAVILFTAALDEEPDNVEALKKFTRAYLACVAALDDCVGTVMNALNASSQANDTSAGFSPILLHKFS